MGGTQSGFQSVNNKLGKARIVDGTISIQPENKNTKVTLLDNGRYTKNMLISGSPKGTPLSHYLKGNGYEIEWTVQKIIIHYHPAVIYSIIVGEKEFLDQQITGMKKIFNWIIAFCVTMVVLGLYENRSLFYQIN